MGKKKKVKKEKGASNLTPGPQDSITLRQEKTGKVNSKVSNNVRTYLNHLENLAAWASRQASIPSLAAFFGQRFAAAAESSGFHPDASLFLCQRCETILQPGSNCSIRIEKNKAKRRRGGSKCNNLTQNNVVYHCHYCSCRNIKGGTPKGHMKMLYAQQSKAVEESKPMESESKEKFVDVKDGKECETAAVQMTSETLSIDAPTVPPPRTGDILTIDAPAIPPPTSGDIIAIDAPAIPPRTEDILTIDAPATPPTAGGKTLLKSKKRKRKKSSSKKQTEPETSCAPTDGEEKTAEIPIVDAPATPPATIGMTLLKSKKRKRKKSSSSMKQTEPENSGAPPTVGEKTVSTSNPTDGEKTVGTSNPTDGEKTFGTSNPTDGENTVGTSKRKRKRKRKSWTSLKEIAQTNEQSVKQNVTDLPIPFSLQGTF